MLHLYLFFHLNMAFSSIEEKDRALVIESCYWPLLSLIEKNKLKIGIELTGYTLELIGRLDHSWVDKFRQLIVQGHIELIGSGYAQIIGPLVPGNVNRNNQQIGLEVYQNFLGIVPQIALINEMAYSRGVLEHYVDAGYEAVIMEWNNPYLFHPEWERSWRYYPQMLTDLLNRQIPVIWSDSVAFQQFQRYVYGENDLEAYIDYIHSQHIQESQYFPLYSNDVEIFDFRPGRFATEEKIQKNTEWKRIEGLFEHLDKMDKIDFILPSSVLEGLNTSQGGKRLNLEAPGQPIPVKKQEKYNINRWALTGRNDYAINTTCHKIAAQLKNNKDNEKHKLLCYCWSSDFRTHITEKRWKKYIEKIEDFVLSFHCESENNTQTSLDSLAESSLDIDHDLILKNKYLSIILNHKKGFAINSFEIKGEKIPLWGTIKHGYYDDISLAADFYSGHAVIEIPAQHKATDLDACNFVMADSNESNSQITYATKVKHATFLSKIILDGNTLYLTKKIILDSRYASLIHPFHFTFIPEAWDFDSLYFETHNGGGLSERFYLNQSAQIYHNAILSPLISAKHALGATNGLVTIGDKDKHISFRHDPGKSAMIPSIIMKQSSDHKLFFRLQYSVQEIDETFVPEEKTAIFNCQLLVTPKIEI